MCARYRCVKCGMDVVEEITRCPECGTILERVVTQTRPRDVAAEGDMSGRRGRVTEPNEILSAEHDAMKRLLTAIDGMARRVESGGDLPRGDLEEAMNLVVEFGDKCHHAKEEKVLFPALSKASPRAGAELARRLTSDHAAFRKLVNSVRQLIPNAEADETSRGLLMKNLRTYSKLLREHISIEDEKLFSEVERSLRSSERKEIAERFEMLEQEEIGQRMHEKYHERINKLADLHVR